MTRFDATGAVQYWDLPSNTQYVTIEAVGAQGAYSGGMGFGLPAPGAGARVKVVADVRSVLPGTGLHVYVGACADGAITNYRWWMPPFGGGGSAQQGSRTDFGGNAGGGASDVRLSPGNSFNRIVVAGGGGGAGIQQEGDPFPGGNAGRAGQTAVQGAPVGEPTSGGFGGSQTAGGARGNSTSGTGLVHATAGTSGQGGRGAYSTYSGVGGGGGGGYFGGGGGGAYPNQIVHAGGGGGGSSAALAGTALISSEAGYNSVDKRGQAGFPIDGHGWVTIEPYVPPTPTVYTSPRGPGIIDLSLLLDAGHPATAGRRTGVFQISQDPTFATGVTEVNGTASDNITSFVGVSITVPKQGTWYARAKSGGTLGFPESGWSANETFVITHVPGATVVSPTGAAFVQYNPGLTAFRVNVTDPFVTDKVTAFQIIVENNATGAVVTDTGKVTVTPAQNIGQLDFGAVIPASAKDTLLRWKARVWDSTDTSSAYTDYALFTLVDPPAVAVTYPAEGGTTDTGAPEFAWTVGLTSGRTAASTKITVREVSTNNLVWQQTVLGATTKVTPATTILINQVQYIVTVEVTDSVGLVGSDSNLFTTSYVSPDPIVYTVDESGMNDLGYIEVNWSNQSPDARLVAWRVYRRTLPNNEWVLLEEIPDEAIKFYRDYLVEAKTSYMYTVTQLADRSGAVLESPVGTRGSQSGDPVAESQIVLADLENYWIISTDYPEMSVLLPGVTSAPDTEEWESETFTIIGRGRHTDYGDRLGHSGTLSVQVRQVQGRSVVRAKVRALRAAQLTYWLRTPFGDLIPIALGNIDWDPLSGVGTNEMGDLSISYNEVA